MKKFLLSVGLAFSVIANATPPELTLMFKESLDNEKTFGIVVKVNPALGKRSADLKVELVFDELAGCDGYAELDGMRVYSWKNRNSVAYAGVIDSGLWNYVTVTSGTHKIRLVVSRPVAVHTFRLISGENGGTQDVVDLRQEASVAGEVGSSCPQANTQPETPAPDLKDEDAIRASARHYSDGQAIPGVGTAMGDVYVLPDGGCFGGKGSCGIRWTNGAEWWFGNTVTARSPMALVPAGSPAAK